MVKSGETTRLIDKAVQFLFKKGELFLLKKNALKRYLSIVPSEEYLFVDPDHKMSNQSQCDFIYRVVKRLEAEHEGSFKIVRVSKEYIHIKVN